MEAKNNRYVHVGRAPRVTPPHHSTLRGLPPCAARRDLVICAYASNMSHTGRTTQLEIVHGSTRVMAKGINRDVQDVHEL